MYKGLFLRALTGTATGKYDGNFPDIGLHDHN